MKKIKWIIGTLGLVAVFMITFQPHAYAYLDPGSGSFFIQMLLAGLLGASFMLKNFWKKVKEFIAKIFSGGKGSGKKP